MKVYHEDTIFNFYEITYHGKNYRILQPEEIEQFWLINQLDGGCNWTETNFYGNRKGLRAWGNQSGKLVFGGYGGIPGFGADEAGNA